MQNLFQEIEAKKYQHDLLDLRAYTSRLLGANEDLVLQGGGNTSVKIDVSNFFDEEEEILYVKGSGHDLKTITAKGFSPVKLSILKRLAQKENLSDTEMVREQKLAMIDQSAPGPSVEAILHAIIPFRFVDHTHSDSVVTLTNTNNGHKIIEEVYGHKVLIVPYVMPGFILARKVFELTRDFTLKDWEKLEGMILLNHGIFTFHHEAKISYDRMINLVTLAENYLVKKGAKYNQPTSPYKLNQNDCQILAKIRQRCSQMAQRPLIASFNNKTMGTTEGPLTPDHVIYTKSLVAEFSEDLKSIDDFQEKYDLFFQQNKTEGIKKLDSAPRVILWKNKGVINLGTNPQLAKVSSDITEHTTKCANWAKSLGGYKHLPLTDLFQVEYWELEQAKLKKIQSSPEFEGQIVLVSGAASGIGKKTAEEFLKLGAAVVALDINPQITAMFSGNKSIGIQCDLTNKEQTKLSLLEGISRFGGLDILVLNAGIFPQGLSISEMKEDIWDKSLSVNLTSNQWLLTQSIVYLKLGHQSSVVVVGSKNVSAPGPGASHYSVAKAGLTQLARVAAMELAPFGININVIHPNNVFDTGIWTEEILKSRADYYKITVEEYKKNNLLKTEITSVDVAQMITMMSGKNFRKITGAQIPLDGGNDRVI